jgi:hypothetical protein
MSPPLEGACVLARTFLDAIAASSTKGMRSPQPTPHHMEKTKMRRLLLATAAALALVANVATTPAQAAGAQGVTANDSLQISSWQSPASISPPIRRIATSTPAQRSRSPSATPGRARRRSLRQPRSRLSIYCNITGRPYLSGRVYADGTVSIDRIATLSAAIFKRVMRALYPKGK